MKNEFVCLHFFLSPCLFLSFFGWIKRKRARKNIKLNWSNCIVVIRVSSISIPLFRLLSFRFFGAFRLVFSFQKDAHNLYELYFFFSGFLSLSLSLSLFLLLFICFVSLLILACLSIQSLIFISLCLSLFLSRSLSLFFLLIQVHFEWTIKLRAPCLFVVKFDSNHFDIELILKPQCEKEPTNIEVVRQAREKKRKMVKSGRKRKRRRKKTAK